MKKLKIFLSIIVIIFCQLSYAQTSKNMRGVWLSTVWSLDFPSSTSLTPSQMKAELSQIISKHKENGINTIFFQVRGYSDAFYQSSIEPWSKFLTGKQGRAPSPLWDPLSYAIDEAHKNGMELHAWINPFRAGAGTASNHIYKTHRDWIVRFSVENKTDYWINPGIPEARTYVVEVAKDIVSRYNIDGLHMDDYFYPYQASSYAYNDDNAFKKYGGNLTKKDDWRRNNVNTFVKQMYDMIKATKPGIKFGISPFGIWKNGTPSGIVGMSQYDEIYCDPIEWLKAGTIDYIAPQLYWNYGGSRDFTKLLNWWHTQAKKYNKQLYAGLELQGKANLNATMVNRMTLDAAKKDGFILFRSKIILANPAMCSYLARSKPISSN